MTYHQMHRARERRSGSVIRKINVRLGLIDLHLEACELPSVSGRPTNVLKLEDDLDDLCDGLLCVCNAWAAVESGPVEVIRGLGARRVDGGGVREVVRLDRRQINTISAQTRPKHTFRCAFLKLPMTRSPAFTLTSGRPDPCEITTSTAA
jgi:hypothetical protein